MATNKNASTRHQELCEQIRHYDEAYYRNANPLVSDQAYDALILELNELEAKYPSLQSSESPTQKVSGVPQDAFKKISRQEKNALP